MASKFTILYVDDERQNLVSFKATFRRDYTIHTANSAEEAIELLQKQPIQLIITDHRMPKMTGVEFLEKIGPNYPNTVRMLLTGYSDVEAIIDAINKVGIYRYLTKPWDERVLRHSIESARQLIELKEKNSNLIHDLKRRSEERDKTLKLFVKYVPREIVERSLENSGESILDGEVRYVVVMFCDIRGFTNMSEKLSPKEVVEFLNDYYSLMTQVIKRHGGTVNQFVGDEVFAAFGAPLDIADKELTAVMCAIEMMQKMQELNAKYSPVMGRNIEVGIGINSGEVVAGNLGSEDKLSYSLTGDVVNTGKRIESLTKDAGGSILISQSIFEVVGDHVETRGWDPIPVKGKSDPILVYEVLGRKEVISRV